MASRTVLHIPYSIILAFYNILFAETEKFDFVSRK